jgi:hypothetical protein
VCDRIEGWRRRRRRREKVQQVVMHSPSAVATRHDSDIGINRKLAGGREKMRQGEAADEGEDEDEDEVGEGV